MKAGSPTEKDAERIAERIYLEYGNLIKDKRTFNEAYSNYFHGSLTDGIEDLRPRIFNILQKRNKKIIDKDLFKKAGGKDFDADRKSTAKELVSTPEQYIKRGAQRVDLKGYDTKQAGTTFKRLMKRYEELGLIKGKSVRIAQDSFKYKGKKRIVYRDSKGRFAKRI
jgi:hypothetical protein